MSRKTMSHSISGNPAAAQITLAVLGLLTSLGALSACAPSASRSSKDIDDVSYSQSDYTSTRKTTATPLPSSSPTPSTTGQLDPVYSQRVGAIGYVGTTFKVKVRKRLRIRVMAELNDEKVKGHGFTPPENHIGVYVKVGTSNRPTPMMDAASQEVSPIMDFSNAFDKTCADDDTDCRQEVTVTVHMPNTDARCVAFRYPCPYERMYTQYDSDGNVDPTQSYPWHVIVYTETDDTEYFTN